MEDPEISGPMLSFIEYLLKTKDNKIERKRIHQNGSIHADVYIMDRIIKILENKRIIETSIENGKKYYKLNESSNRL